MNKVLLVGRISRMNELKNGTTAVLNFSIAVDRKFKNGGDQNADFISCVAFGKTAEFISKYFVKGQRIGVEGRIQSGTYEKKDGSKVYSIDVIIDNAEFVESKSAGEPKKTEPNANGFGFMDVADGMEDEGLPFI